MSSLLEISPQSREISIGDDKIKVYGWSAEAIADLLSAYREEIGAVAEAFKSAADEGKSFQAMITGADSTILDTLSYGVMPSAIVWASRLPRKEAADIIKAEAVVRDLPVSTQLLFLKNAYDLTFPEGLGDFLTALGLTVQGDSATSSNTGLAA